MDNTSVYLDNAATTKIDPEVFDEMKPYMVEYFGNPSSIHSHGRKARTAIELSRKKVAELLNASPSEIFFTSGGTEADNMAIRCTIADRNIKHIISSRIEHHAVLHTLQALSSEKTAVSYVELDKDGQVNYAHLEELLKQHPNSLVTLMQANNEIGNLLDLEKVGSLSNEYGAIFHSDTVQSMAHYVHDMEKLALGFAVGSAHKFHGPKGVGFLYINHNNKTRPFIHGGAQERNMRGGTENVYGIVGLAKAMEIAYTEMEAHRKHIESLKLRMVTRLKSSIQGVAFNGTSGDLENSLYTVLSVSLPPSDESEMLLFKLDIEGISVSGGSACSSGSNIGSHVLAELDRDQNMPAIRFSFSKYNTEEEVDYTVEKLSSIYQNQHTSS